MAPGSSGVFGRTSLLQKALERRRIGVHGGAQGERLTILSTIFGSRHPDQARYT